MVVAKLLVFVSAAVLGVPLRAAGVLALPALWGYVLLAGAPPSAVRAAAMASFSFVAPVFWRRPDGLLAWAVTFLAVYGSDPARMTDVGCGLSFAVMLALVLWNRVAVSLGLAGPVAALGLTFAAWAAGVPLAARVFGRVTPGALAANLAVVPAASGSVAAGALGVLASFVSTPLAAHVNNAAALFTRAMTGISRAVAAIPGASVEVAPWPLWACALWYAAFVAAGAALTMGRRGVLRFSPSADASAA